jgi:hypothetical protein
MTCAEIEDLIASDSEWDVVEAHARACESCREYAAAARQLDLALSSVPQAPAHLRVAVMAALEPKPSYVPVLLDFVGWAAMIAVAAGLAGQLIATY